MVWVHWVLYDIPASATGLDEAVTKLPAGTLDRLPDGSIEDPDLAAPRELGEETGYGAGSWRKLGRFWTTPGFTEEDMRRWHRDFERLEPRRHQRFLAFLGIPPEEIRKIRSWARTRS